MSKTTYNRYSEQVKQAVAESKNPNLFPELKIPKSTAYQWIKDGVAKRLGEPKPLLRTFPFNQQSSEEIYLLRLLLRCTEGSFNLHLLNDHDKVRLRMQLKSKWLSKHLSSSQLLNLQKQLYTCPVSADGVCVKRFPLKMTTVEIQKMRGMYEGREFAYMPVCSLALKAKRDGVINCSAQTWSRYAKKFGWKRPFRKGQKKQRKYIGLKAKRPHEIWQMDVTELKLADGSKRFLQAIIDNFSRYIIDWQLLERISKKSTNTIVSRAIKKYGVTLKRGVWLVTDGGPENKGIRCKKYGSTVVLIQRLAQHEIKNANTLIEVFFKTLKHDYLLHQEYNTYEELLTAISFFIEKHNSEIPRVAIGGCTPKEVLNETRIVSPKQMEKTLFSSSPRERLEFNRSVNCNRCV